MGYGIDLFPLKSLITVIKSTPKMFAAVEEISDLAVPGIKGLAKPGCVVYVQLEKSSYGLYVREYKTFSLVSCTTRSSVAPIKRLCCTLQRSQNFC